MNLLACANAQALAALIGIGLFAVVVLASLGTWALIACAELRAKLEERRS